MGCSNPAMEKSRGDRRRSAGRATNCNRARRGQSHRHDPGISTAMGEVRADTIAITTGFAPADVQQLLPKELRTAGQWTEGDFVAARDALRAIAPRLWEARSGEAVLTPRETRVELAAG